MAELSSQPTLVQTLYTWYREGKLMVNRRYQRKLVWTLEEKQKLIDSILLAYPIPAILLWENRGVFEIIDGLQRLHTIHSFIETSFPTERGSFFDLNFFPTAMDNMKNELFIDHSTANKLTSNECSAILNYSLAASIMRNAEETEVNDVFNRINTYGHRLSDQERRQSGVHNRFAELVRDLACSFRGDVSTAQLPLYDMPAISIDLPKTRHGYQVRADEVFWVQHGILRSTDLRDSLDEQCLADVVACIVGQDLIDRSKVAIDAIYEQGSSESQRVAVALDTYGSERVADELKYCIEQIQTVCGHNGHSKLRDILFPKKQTNAFPSIFAGVLIAFHEIIVGDDNKIADLSGLKHSLHGVASRMDAGQKGSDKAQRRQNIDVVKGLIAKYFVSDATVRHAIYSDHKSIDIEGDVRRSVIETPHYELKQGLLQLKAGSVDPGDMLKRLPQIVCGLANNGPEFAGKLIIGVADNQRDAERVEKIDGTSPREVGDRWIVGIQREAVRLDLTIEEYNRLIRQSIENSKLSEPLKSDVSACLDYCPYHGLGIVVIAVRPQKQPSYCGDDLFYRSGDQTIKAATAKEAGDVSARFR